jgi:hypothetical protein
MTENAAWVSVELPMPPGEALVFARDTEALFRFNPYLEIESWEQAGNRLHLHCLNEMNGQRLDLHASLADLPGSGYRIDYAEGLKLATEIRVEPHAAGSLLTLGEHYRDVAPDDMEALKQVDRSLTPWGVAIRRHALSRTRWGRLPGYRALVRFWYAMPPRSRRISRLILWVTVLEFAVFLFVFAIYFNETLR